MLAFISIFCALAVGYLLADYQYRGVIRRRFGHHLNRFQHTRPEEKHSGYYDVLTGLLNEQPDEGLDAFVASMAVSAETFEVHVALASLLRRRGEFARAVKVHENLIQHGGLSDDKVHKVQLELAIDYWRSGMLDRAESILKQLTDRHGITQPVAWQASAYLVEIYQDLEQWLDAIEMADRLTEKKFSNEPDLWRVLQAHFSCELAAQARNNSDHNAALTKSRQALSYDPNNVRAKCLLAELALDEHDHPLALSYLLPLASTNPEYISELIDPLRRCLEGNHDEYSRVLRDIVIEHNSVTALLALSKASINKEENATTLWRDVLANNQQAIPEAEIMILALSDLCTDDVRSVVFKLEEYLNSRQRYLCKNCGAEYSKLQWRCVSCNAWSSIQTEIP